MNNDFSLEQILKMIRTYDPENRLGMKEINARVYAFLNLQGDFQVSFSDGGSVYYRHNSWPNDASTVLLHLFDSFNYTTSRDKLKEIRPDGWRFEIYPDTEEGWTCYMTSVRKDKENQFSAYYLPTEELAELYAIIQAIDFERGCE